MSLECAVLWRGRCGYPGLGEARGRRWWSCAHSGRGSRHLVNAGWGWDRSDGLGSGEKDAQDCALRSGGTGCQQSGHVRRCAAARRRLGTGSSRDVRVRARVGPLVRAALSFADRLPRVTRSRRSRRRAGARAAAGRRVLPGALGPNTVDVIAEVERVYFRSALPAIVAGRRGSAVRIYPGGDMPQPPAADGGQLDVERHKVRKRPAIRARRSTARDGAPARARADRSGFCHQALRSA